MDYKRTQIALEAIFCYNDLEVLIMIISVSRRTDIPAFYMDWFLNRQKEGYVLTRNPMNPKQISRISFKDISCYVFWTKNPKYLVEYYQSIMKHFIAQVTITPYTKDVEKCIEDKRGIIRDTLTLAKLNKNHVIWRYDPIMITDKYSIEYHLEYFEKLCRMFEGVIKTCVISFVDVYSKVKKSLEHIKPLSEEDKLKMAISLKDIADAYGIELRSCGNFEGIKKSTCIDGEMLKDFGITGYKKDKHQRDTCNCLESVDIGTYNTCVHHCIYCYANHNHERAENFFHNFDMKSEILGQPLNGDETIKDRVIKPKLQISLF